MTEIVIGVEAAAQLTKICIYILLNSCTRDLSKNAKW